MDILAGLHDKLRFIERHYATASCTAGHVQSEMPFSTPSAFHESLGAVPELFPMFRGGENKVDSHRAPVKTQCPTRRPVLAEFPKLFHDLLFEGLPSFVLGQNHPLV